MCEITGKFGPGMEEDSRTIDANQFGANVEEVLATRIPRERKSLSDLGSPPPSSSSDATFEPTIDMMVNDFDDEQTLNEEEALAALECGEHDEIATLKEESEMPIEELLAKYQSLPKPEASRKKTKKIIRRTKHKQQEEKEASTQIIDKERNRLTEMDDAERNIQSDVIVIESGDEELVGADQKTFEDDDDETGAGTELENTVVLPLDGEAKYAENSIRPVEKARRSHLLDLYPEESFRSVGGGQDKVVALEMLYGDDDEEDDDEAEDEETDIDYAKKTIMVGGAYQAVIPIGLSQYGDVLPYENEDKLIWEPSQVGEREVEDYLLKAREIKPTLSDDELTDAAIMDVVPKEISNEKSVDTESDDVAEELLVKMPLTKNIVPPAISGVEGEQGVGVVRDNEQALHLLVQCGYDFKEALRRKRLNAVPLTGSMSLWSEEECHKFEEGIQKFGKDFLKIRQNQVRTRSMRELVQFYYLWKKSDRRDNDFANSDTVDHMDIYLNEGGDYGTNTVAATCVLPGVPSTVAPTLPTRKTITCVQKNFSIMTGSNVGSTASNSQTNTAAAATAKAAFSRKRGTAAGQANLLISNNNDSQNLSATASCANCN